MKDKITQFINKNRTLIAVILIILMVITITVVLLLPQKVTAPTEKTSVIIGNVLKVSDNKITITNTDGTYEIKTNDIDYKVGSTIKVKVVKKNKKLIARKIKLISEPTTIVDVEEVDTNNKTTESSSNNESNSSNTTEEQNETQAPQTEESVISYVEDIDNKLSTSTYSSNSGTIKEGFVKVIDFIFYGGSINGKTFSELSTSAKLKVLKVATSIDNKIDSYFPGYKEQISSTASRVYTKLKTKIVETYLDITTKICDYDQNICTQAKEDFSTMKSSYGLTWSFIKEIAGSGVSKLKSWYAIWKNT